MVDKNDRIRASKPFSGGATFDDLFSSMTGGPDDKPDDIPEGALIPVKQDNGLYQLGPFLLTEVGVEIHPETSRENWRLLGNTLGAMGTSISWLTGDWAVFALDNFDYSYEQLSEQFGLSIETLYTYASCCTRFPISIRNRDASFGHHRIVQGMQDRWVNHWLQKVIENKWTVKQLSDNIKKEKKKRIGTTSLLADDPALKKGKRLFSKQKEMILLQKMRELAKLKDGVSEAGQGAKDQIYELLSDIREFIDSLEQIVE